MNNHLAGGLTRWNFEKVPHNNLTSRDPTEMTGGCSRERSRYSDILRAKDVVGRILRLDPRDFIDEAGRYR